MKGSCKKGRDACFQVTIEYVVPGHWNSGIRKHQQGKCFVICGDAWGSGFVFVWDEW